MCRYSSFIQWACCNWLLLPRYLPHAVQMAHIPRSAIPLLGRRQMAMNVVSYRNSKIITPAEEWWPTDPPINVFLKASWLSFERVYTGVVNKHRHDLESYVVCWETWHHLLMREDLWPAPVDFMLLRLLFDRGRYITTSNRSCRFTGLGCHGWIINWLESNAALTTIVI